MMTAISPDLGELSATTPALSLPSEIAACLSDGLRKQLAQLPASKRAAFIEAFHNESRSLPFAYLTSLIYCHYGLLGRWALTGIMWLSLFVSSTLGPALGSIWWLIDLVRLPGMVRSHNQQVAAAILDKLAAGDRTAALPGA
jgi:hypothetical protein